MQLVAEKETGRATKARKQKDTEIRRKQSAAKREQQQRDRPADQPFTGALSSKRKPDLQEIAGALDLSEDGTREALISRINELFEQKQVLRNTPRFSGSSIQQNGEPLHLKIQHSTLQTCSTFKEIHVSYSQQTS